MTADRIAAPPAWLSLAALLLATTSGALAQVPFEDYPEEDLPLPATQRAIPVTESGVLDAYQRQPPAQTQSPAQTSQSSGLNASLVSRGQSAFQAQCGQCHPLSRATSETKSLAGWKATVARMAGKTGSDVVSADRLAIATYLASLSAPAQPAATGAAPAAAQAAPAESQAFSLFSTLSPVWRGGTTHLQHPGFFPQAWLGVDWQHENNPVSAHVTACVTCHLDDGGNSFALVKASMRLDLSQLVATRFHQGRHEARAFPNVRASVEAGRFVVPFGAFSSQVNPGVYRTVTRPLIFNMGQRIYDPDIGDPVLPMPYADEGATFSIGAPVLGDLRATADAYVVNGLQGNADGIAFDDSRSYVDNNASASGGARVTLGNRYLTVGGSMIDGRFNPNGGSPMFPGRLDYSIYGADISFHLQDIFRFQAEYARRISDRVVALPGALVATEQVEGAYVLGELRVTPHRDIRLISRYDVLDHDSPLPPPESSLAVGNFRVTRFTWGLNFGIPGGSLLMLNHEHWWVPGPLTNVDVVGVRWAGTY